jgi:Tfp pilus assembly protein FimV
MWQSIFKSVEGEGAMHSFLQDSIKGISSRGLSAVVIALCLLTNLSHAAPINAERALARLMKDVQRLEPQLAKNQSEDGYYRTQLGDTVDMILLRMLPNMPVKKAILRQALVKANPHAFKRSNPNWMYAGKRLRLPTADDIHNVVFIKQSNKTKSKPNERLSWVKYP